jgi:hypothetical protein
MAVRDQKSVVQFKTRMREPLRARLASAARRRGVTLNTEIVDRLEQSFAKEEAFGGAEILNMARLMAAAFVRGGHHAAYAQNRPKWTSADWLNDPDCYQAAARAVSKALAAAKPELEARQGHFDLAFERPPVAVGARRSELQSPPRKTRRRKLPRPQNKEEGATE